MMQSIRALSPRVRILQLFISLAAAMPAAAIAADWQPAKPVEIVVAAGAQGSQTAAARSLASFNCSKTITLPFVTPLTGTANNTAAAVEGSSTRIFLGSMTDPLPGASKTYSGTVDWKDGTSSAASFTKTGNGTFDLFGQQPGPAFSGQEARRRMPAARFSRSGASPDCVR